MFFPDLDFRIRSLLWAVIGLGFKRIWIDFFGFLVSSDIGSDFNDSLKG